MQKVKVKAKTAAKPRKATSKGETFASTLTRFLEEREAMYQQEVAVNATSAMSFPPFYRAVSLVSSTVAQLPIKVYKRSDRTVDDRHPAGKLIRRPHTMYGWYSLMRSIVKDTFLHGGGYAEIIRDALSFQPIRLDYLDPNYVQFDLEKLLYKFKGRVIFPENILHFKNIGSPYLGDNPLETHRESLSLGLSMQRYGKNWFTNGVHNNLWFMLPGWLPKDKEQRQQFLEGIENRSGGLRNVAKPGVLQNGATVEQLEPPDNAAAQFVEGRDCEAIQAANIVGIPPYLAGAKLASSYSSFESEAKRFLREIEAVIFAVEEELSIKLLTAAQLENNTHYIEASREGLLRADKKTETEILIAQLDAGILTLRQVCEKLNLPTDDLGPEGDERRLPSKPAPAPEPEEKEADDTASGDVQPPDETQGEEQGD